jgi:hypothetical protein
MITPKPSRSMKTMKKMMRSAPLGGGGAGSRGEGAELMRREKVPYTGGGFDSILQTEWMKHWNPMACFFRRSLMSESVKFPAESNLLFTRRNKHAIRVRMGIAIAKDHLKLLDRAEPAPHAGRLADECDGLAIEALGELEHVDEIFQHARERAVVFRGDDMQALRVEHALLDRLHRGRFFGVGARIKNMERHFFQAEQLGRDFGIAIVTKNDLSKCAARSNCARLVPLMIMMGEGMQVPFSIAAFRPVSIWLQAAWWSIGGIRMNKRILSLLLAVALSGCTQSYASREYTLDDDLPPQPTAAQLQRCPDGHDALKDVPIVAGLLWMTPELQRKIENVEVWPVGCRPIGIYTTQVVCMRCKFAYKPVFGHWERRSQDPTDFHRPLSPLVRDFPRPAFAAANFYQRIHDDHIEGESMIYWTKVGFEYIREDVLKFAAAHDLEVVDERATDERYPDAIKLRGRWNERYFYVDVRRHAELNETLVEVYLLDETAARRHDPLSFVSSR